MWLGGLLIAVSALAQNEPAPAQPPAQPASPPPRPPGIFAGPDGRPYIMGLDGRPWPVVPGTNGQPHVLLPDGRVWPLHGPPPPPPKNAAWNHSINVRSGVGYKDNVLLSATDPRASAFYTGGLDLMFMRRPTSGYLFSFFASGDYVHYLRPTGVENEQVAFATTQLIKDLGHDWKTGLGAQYSYQNQVFDASANETNFVIGQVEGHGIGGRWMLRKDLKQYRAELEVGFTRQFFREPLDDFWQYGPRLTLGRAYGHGSDLALSYGIFRVDYDTRETINFDGTNITAGSEALYFLPQTVELVWQHHWDKNQRWRTVTRLGWERNADNGSGFFNYDRYRTAAQLRYRARTWEASVGASVSHYDYESQPVSTADPTARTKTALSINARLEKNLHRRFKVFGNYGHDRSLSNLSVDQYEANTFSAGFDWQF